MSKRQYDAATAKSLMEFAYPEYGEHDIKPYEIRADGVYVTEAFREVCPPAPGTFFDWAPADEVQGPRQPNPKTAPFLPIPFDAAQLAAAMIDGPGQSIEKAMGHRLGSLLDTEALNRLAAREPWIRDALAEAYELADAAQSVVGAFNHQAKARAQATAAQYDDTNGAAYQREGVFDDGITEDERRIRRERAATFLLPMKTAAYDARDNWLGEWQRWRTAMTRQLLAPAPPLSEAERDSLRKQEAAWFYCGILDLGTWTALEDVRPQDAAMLLAKLNPDEPKDAQYGNDYPMLTRRLADHAHSHPGPHTLADWWKLALEWKKAGQLHDVRLDPDFGEALLLLDAQNHEVAGQDTEALEQDDGKEAPDATASAGTAEWTVVKPKRYRGYIVPLYRLLVDAHREGKPRPTARDVVEAWRVEKPADIAKVMPNEIDYYDAEGGTTKTADLEAIRKAINRMTSAR